MSAAATISLLSALLGLSIQALEAREKIKLAALASGGITEADLQEQDTLLAAQVAMLKLLVAEAQP